MSRTLLAALVVLGIAGCDPPKNAKDHNDAAATTTSLLRAPSPSTSTTAPRFRTRAPRPGEAVLATTDGVLGWWDGAKWIAREEDNVVPAVGGERYTIVVGGEVGGTAVGGEPYLGCFDEWATIGLGRLGPGVAVSGVANPVPRAVGSDTTDHRADAARVMRTLGVADPQPRVLRAFRTDLEGDGTTESVVVARHGSDGFDRAVLGDASVVFVRTSGGELVVVDAAITDDPWFVMQSKTTLDINAIADFNGDGRYEIAIDSQYYEGGGTRLLVDGPTLRWYQALSVGCGA